jgi:L-asparagine transporter-like permease
MFPSPFYPYSNYIPLAFIILVLAVMAKSSPAMAKQVIAIPVWILVVYAGYKISKIRKA